MTTLDRILLLKSKLTDISDTINERIAEQIKSNGIIVGGAQSLLNALFRAFPAFFPHAKKIKLQNSRGTVSDLVYLHSRTYVLRPCVSRGSR